jgi:VWFA-related protein
VTPKRRQKRSLSRAVLSLSSVILLFSLFGPGQVVLTTAAQEVVRPQKPIQHEVTVTLKLIQVIVTDKQGNPVTDLKKEDFVLTDNGKEMKLTDFEKHILSLPSAEAPAEEKVAATPLPAPRLLNRKFILLFDFAYNNPAGVRKMPEVALRFLDTKILPTDEVGVLSYSLLKLLQVHLYLTTDHQKVRDFVSKIGLRDSSQRFEDLEDKYKRELEAGGLVDARPESKLTQPTPEMPELDQAEMWRRSIKDYTHSLSALAYALRSVEGQKHLVLFSEGIPYPQLYPIAQGPDNPWEILLKDLQTANIQVHALYTGGITLSDWLTGAWTLAKTSYETGGQYWGNMYNYEPFVEKVNAVTGSYYVLGYPISEAWDGAYHRIHVTVNRPDVVVRAQWGYSNPKPFSDCTDLEKRIQLVDLALAEKPISQTPARFEMSVLPFRADPAGNVLFAARIPRDKLENVAGKKVEVVGLVFNEADEIVDLRRNVEDLTRVTSSGIYLLSTLAVPPGAYRFRVVIRNLETGAAARAGVTTAVPEAKTSGITLLAPVLWKPERGAFYLKSFAPKVAGKTPPRPLLEILGVDTRQYVPYTEKTLASPSEVWASIRCAAAGIAAPKVKLSASLEDLEFGGIVAVGLKILSEKDEPEGKAYFIRLEIPEVEPGSYRLTLRAEETTSGQTSAIANDYIIERTISRLSTLLVEVRISRNS